ncbi:MAG: hypothetical protein LBE82_04800 [Chitinophagaceae bacterium]|jgi:hypothetical protein|nr:hypothetical protein [Chitinophagaceae bacterium]
MSPSVRLHYNQNFTQEKYAALLQSLENISPGDVAFRVAETPVFVPKDLKEKLITACEQIIDVIVQPDFKEHTKNAIPKEYYVPNEDEHCDMISLDFGVCKNDKGELIPQLIEMQGFPTISCFVADHAAEYSKHFDIPETYSHYLNGFTAASFSDLFRKIILDNCAPENVILLEINPKEQKTRIDYTSTRNMVGIATVNITDLIQEERDLYYLLDGKKTQIKRIYNRIIFDDLEAQKHSLGKFVDITKPLNVAWVPHPNWFYRISKYALPFIKSPYVPETNYLSEIKTLPADLENYVLKPLFSFAGQGVIIDVSKEDIDKIFDRENWILQRKVEYAAAIETPGEPAKCELRMMYFWEKGAARPVLPTGLARLSKGKMIGVRYNTDKDWVGSSIPFFEK